MDLKRCARECPDSLPSESALRMIERGVGARLSPGQIREILQVDDRLAASREAGQSPRYDAPEDWLAAEQDFLGYRMDLIYRRCEIKLTALEALQALCALLRFPADVPFDLTGAWRKLLDAETVRHAGKARQDAAVSALMAVSAGADAAWEALAGRMVAPNLEGGWASIFNLYPTRRTMLTCIRSKGPVSVYLGERRLPSQFIDGDDATAIEIEMDGLSVERVRIEPNGPAYESVPMDGPYRFENDVLRVEVQEDGRITLLESKRHGRQLAFGNVLRGRWKDVTGRAVLLRGEDLPLRGRVVRGELFDNLYIEGGRDGVEVGMVLYLPRHGSRRIEIMLDITLAGDVREAFLASGGALWAEWHTDLPHPQIRCDRPFGWASCAEGEALRSSNGVGITQDGRGLIFDHQGVTRSFFKDGVLYTLLGKGGPAAREDGPAGLLDARSPDSPDCGKWRFFYAIDLADEDGPEHLFGRISSYQFPMLPVRCRRPVSARGLLTLDDGLLPTSLSLRDGKPVLRGWNAAETPVPLRCPGLLGFDAGRPLEPFEIFEREL